MDRVPTGSRILDGLLSGGLPPGAAVLVSGDEGAGATEFALTVLHTAATAGKGRQARLATALRSPARVVGEAGALFQDPKAGLSMDVQPVSPPAALADPRGLLRGLQAGDVLVVESADALVLSAPQAAILPFWRELGDAAQATGVLAMLLHSHGTLAPGVEHALAEGADGVFHFGWQSGGPVRRRHLAVTKLRGLAPIVDGEQVPVFDVALHRGMGFAISRDKSVI